MATILSTIKTSTIKKQNQLSPIQNRRNRLLSTLHLQIEAVKARQEGKRHSIKRNCKILNPETGEKIDTIKESAVREAWWIGDDSKVYLEVRYGFKALEISKGKTTIDVGDGAQLIPTLEKLKQATEHGEFDDQLNAAYTRLAAQLKGKNSRK